MSGPFFYGKPLKASTVGSLFFNNLSFLTTVLVNCSLLYDFMFETVDPFVLIHVNPDESVLGIEVFGSDLLTLAEFPSVERDSSHGGDTCLFYINMCPLFFMSLLH